MLRVGFLCRLGESLLIFSHQRHHLINQMPKLVGKYDGDCLTCCFPKSSKDLPPPPHKGAEGKNGALPEVINFTCWFVKKNRTLIKLTKHVPKKPASRVSIIAKLFFRSFSCVAQFFFFLKKSSEILSPPPPLEWPCLRAENRK